MANDFAIDPVSSPRSAYASQDISTTAADAPGSLDQSQSPEGIKEAIKKLLEKLLPLLQGRTEQKANDPAQTLGNQLDDSQNQPGDLEGGDSPGGCPSASGNSTPATSNCDEMQCAETQEEEGEDDEVSETEESEDPSHSSNHQDDDQDQ